ncbi:MAG: cysteine hydrolase [Coriobacteriia bacterium]|nr:cysteine hydrolase [Coriobacteriia bacterium]
MKKLLIVVDMQNDFITGTLGSPQAQSIVPLVKAKIEQYRQNGDAVLFTRDTHQDNYLETQEGRYLPVVHCIEGTEGHAIAEGLLTAGLDTNGLLTAGLDIKGLDIKGLVTAGLDTNGLSANGSLTNGDEVFDKPTFGSLELASLVAKGGFDEIELCGLCTDICVVSNALILKAQLPEIKVTVDARCCAGVSDESHNAALLTMKACQVDII